MSFPNRKELLLSAHVAALTNVDDDLLLLSVIPRVDDAEILVRGIYAHPPDDNQKDLVECVATEIVADMSLDVNVVTDISHNRFPETLGEQEDVIFVAREYASQVPVWIAPKQPAPSYSDILLSGYRAAVGRVDVSLRLLFMEIQLADRCMILTGWYRKQLGEFQMSLLNEIRDSFAAELGQDYVVESRIGYSDARFLPRSEDRALFCRHGD